jgi:Na+/H+ antiporter NhaD/arsenite permease-like protein
VAALLSAVFSNDVICLAMAPLVARLACAAGCRRCPSWWGWPARPTSARPATLIGNPQNMLIGSVLKLPFGAYLRPGRRRWGSAWCCCGPGWRDPCRRARPSTLSHRQAAAAPSAIADEPPFDALADRQGPGAWPLALMGVFLFTDWPRDVAALVGAGVLLLSRRLHSAEVMGLVDWPLLLLFIGLFVVNHAFAHRLTAQAVAWLVARAWPWPNRAGGAGRRHGAAVQPGVQRAGGDAAAAASGGPTAGPLLALVSTLAGNLLLVGSIANLIVADLAAKEGVTIGWREHLRLAAPAAFGSLLITALCLG